MAKTQVTKNGKTVTTIDGLLEQWEEYYRAFTMPFFTVIKPPDAMLGLRQCIDELKELKAKLDNPGRLRFVQDDSSHWYAIPAGFRQEFDAWVQSFEDSGDTPEYEGPDFDEYRIDGHPSFYTFTGLERG